jgi:hypothetical protein
VTTNRQQETEEKLGKLRHRIREIEDKEQEQELREYIGTETIQNRPSPDSLPKQVRTRAK